MNLTRLRMREPAESRCLGDNIVRAQVQGATQIGAAPLPIPADVFDPRRSRGGVNTCRSAAARSQGRVDWRNLQF